MARVSGDGEIVDGVGARLRTLRKNRDLTLVQLAAASGIPVSTLSRLENSRVGLTLAQMLPLARVYKLPLDELVAATATGDPRLHLRPLQYSGITYIPLSDNAQRLQAFKVLYPPARDLPPARRHTHPGRQWIYVLAGSVAIHVVDEITEVQTGHAMEFDASKPHWIGNLNNEDPAEVLAIYGRDGARPVYIDSER